MISLVYTIFIKAADNATHHDCPVSYTPVKRMPPGKDESGLGEPPVFTGPSSQVNESNYRACVGEWGEFSECSASCGFGYKTRFYNITDPGEPHGIPCDLEDGHSDVSYFTSLIHSMVNALRPRLTPDPHRPVQKA